MQELDTGDAVGVEQDSGKLGVENVDGALELIGKEGGKEGNGLEVENAGEKDGKIEVSIQEDSTTESVVDFLCFGAPLRLCVDF